MKPMRRAIPIILMMAACLASLSGCAEKIETDEGIAIVSGTIGRPAQGELVFVPVDASGFFAVDGALGGRRTIRIGADPNGVLFFDLALDLASVMEVDAEIGIFESGNQFVSYAESGVSLPSGDNEINASIDTGEDVPCSGESTARFYIDGHFVNETTGSV